MDNLTGDEWREILEKVFKKEENNAETKCLGPERSLKSRNTKKPHKQKLVNSESDENIFEQFKNAFQDV